MNEEKVLDAFGDLESILADDKEGTEALEIVKEAYKSMQTLYTIEDEKYGLQAIFIDEETAKKELETGKYHISGYGSNINKWKFWEKN